MAGFADGFATGFSVADTAFQRDYNRKRLDRLDIEQQRQTDRAERIQDDELAYQKQHRRNLELYNSYTNLTTQMANDPRDWSTKIRDPNYASALTNIMNDSAFDEFRGDGKKIDRWTTGPDGNLVAMLRVKDKNAPGGYREAPMTVNRSSDPNDPVALLHPEQIDNIIRSQLGKYGALPDPRGKSLQDEQLAGDLYGMYEGGGAPARGLRSGAPAGGSAPTPAAPVPNPAPTAAAMKPVEPPAAKGASRFTDKSAVPLAPTTVPTEADLSKAEATKEYWRGQLDQGSPADQKRAKKMFDESVVAWNDTKTEVDALKRRGDLRVQRVNQLWGEDRKAAKEQFEAEEAAYRASRRGEAPAEVRTAQVSTPDRAAAQVAKQPPVDNRHELAAASEVVTAPVRNNRPTKTQLRAAMRLARAGFMTAEQVSNFARTGNIEEDAYQFISTGGMIARGNKRTGEMQVIYNGATPAAARKAAEDMMKSVNSQRKDNISFLNDTFGKYKGKASPDVSKFMEAMRRDIGISDLGLLKQDELPYWVHAYQKVQQHNDEMFNGGDWSLSDLMPSVNASIARQRFIDAGMGNAVEGRTDKEVLELATEYYKSQQGNE